MSKEILSNYSPEDVVVILGGVFEVGGYHEGTFISISKDVPLFTTKESSDGKVGRVRNKSGLYTVSLTLMSTTSSNEVMTRLGRLDSRTGMGKFPITIKDTLGKTVFFSPCAWVEELPETDFDIAITSRVWGIKCSCGDIMIGGNEGDGLLVSDIVDQIPNSTLGQMF